MFYGEHKRHLDEKNRVMIPAEYRALVSDAVYVTMGFDRCLMILMPDTYGKLLQDINKLPVTDPNVRNLRRMFMSKSHLIKLDGSSRIRVPAELSGSIGMQAGSEIVLAGNGSYIEMWTTDGWDAVNQSLADPDLNAERYQNFELVFADPQQPEKNPSSSLPGPDSENHSE
ncbi:MAG: hypothetical protein HPY85_01040 [Anaerolineae bacterium]|nr:hypothetical protein [Anaerolineae bacterium]